MQLTVPMLIIIFLFHVQTYSSGYFYENEYNMEGDCLNVMYNEHIIFEQEFRGNFISVRVLKLKDPNTLKYKHSKVNI